MSDITNDEGDGAADTTGVRWVVQRLEGSGVNPRKRWGWALIVNNSVIVSGRAASELKALEKIDGAMDLYRALLVMGGV